MFVRRIDRDGSAREVTKRPRAVAADDLVKSSRQ